MPSIVVINDEGSVLYQNVVEDVQDFLVHVVLPDRGACLSKPRSRRPARRRPDPAPQRTGRRPVRQGRDDPSGFL